MMKKQMKQLGNMRRKMISFVLIVALVMTGMNLDMMSQSIYAAKGNSENEKGEKKVTVVKELAEERTENSNTYLLSDGSKRLDVCSEDIRYEEGGELKEYDASLVCLNAKEKRKLHNLLKKVKAKNYTAVNASGDSKQYFPNKLDGKTSVVMSKGKYLLSFMPVIEKEQYNSSIEKDSIVYKSDNIISEYQYISQKSGVKENIILSSKPFSNEISFEIFTENMKLILEKKSGSVNFIDTNNGKKVGYILPPNMTDARGQTNYKDISYKIVKKGKKAILKLIIDEKYLENATYPIVVDPTAVWCSEKLTAAMVSSLSFVRNQCWTADTLVVKNKSDRIKPYIGTEQRVYLDMSAIMSGDAYINGPLDWSDKQINKVTLSISESAAGYALGAVEIRETAGSWSMDSLSWNNQPPIGEVVGSFECDGIDGTRHEIDLTEFVKEMIKAENAYKGLVFTAEEGTGAGFKGPEIGNGYMWISIVYNMESIALTEYDCSKKTQKEYDYLYDGNLNDTIEQPYIPSQLATTDDLLQTFSIYPGDSLDDANENIFPYSTIVRVASEKDSDGDGVKDDYRGFGSGYIIGPNVVATAGHCVWSGNSGWVEDIKLLTRVNDDNYNQSFDIKEIICPTQYIKTCSGEYDWAIIIVDGNIGENNGWLGFGMSNNLVGKGVTVAGYTGAYGDKYGKLYKKEGNIADVSRKKVFYNLSTISGQSGGPVFDADYIAWAVHTSGYGVSAYNSGTRIDAGLFSLLKKKRRESIDSSKN